MVVNRLPKIAYRLTYLDLSQNQIGPVGCIPIGIALEDPSCAIKTLYLQGTPCPALSALPYPVLSALILSCAHCPLPCLLPLSTTTTTTIIITIIQAGSRFGTAEDANLGHGIALQRALMANVMLRELDLSYNAMSTETCEGVMKAMLQNHVIRRLSLRGNKMDDNVADALFDLITFNNVLEELDLGENMLGYSCSHSLGESIGTNRALKVSER